MKYLVYLPVPEHVQDKVRSVQSQVNLVTRSRPNPIHATIYLMEIERSKEEKMLDALSSIDVFGVRVKSESLDLFGEDKDTLVYRCQKSSAIEALHYQVIDLFTQFPKTRLMQGNTFEEQSRARLYGSIWFGDVYQPHVTIARLTGQVNLDSITFEPFDWMTDCLRVARRDNDSWTPIQDFTLETTPNNY